MPTMFEDTAMKLVKNIGDSELRPVRCLLDASKIRQFSLIRRNKARSLKPADVPLNVSLMDILEPSASVPGLCGRAAAGGWESDCRARSERVGEPAESQRTLLKCQVVTHSNATWEDLLQRTLKDSELSVLKQCRDAGEQLYVVTETVELVKGCVLEDCRSADVQTVGQGGCPKVSRRKLTVPKDSVMAYKRKQLVFTENTWGILHFADDDEQETFQEWKIKRQGRTGLSFPIVPRADFKCLQEDVSKKVVVVQHLKDTQGVVFSSIRAMLRDREALQDLMGKLEPKPLGRMDGPGGTILNELRKDSSSPWVNSVHLLLYLLEAIMVLSDTQRDLLAQSMERKILAQQRDLVRSILEPNFKRLQRIPFTLQPEVLTPLQGENLAITYDLLDECGLKMERSSPQSTWDPEAKEPLCALYRTFCVLRQLAKA